MTTARVARARVKKGIRGFHPARELTPQTWHVLRGYLNLESVRKTSV